MRTRSARFATQDGRSAEIRSARPNEAGALLDHLERVHARDPGSNPEPTYTVDSLRVQIAALREAPDGALLVAVADSAVVGSLAVRAVAPAAAELGISVHPAWRRQGVATRLLRTAIAAARAGADLRRLTLEVAADNRAAIGLYESLGFRDEGATDDGSRRMALDVA